MISKEEFLAGRPFLGNVEEPPPSLREIDQTARVTNKAQARHDKIAATQKENLNPTVTSTAATKGAFKTPLLNNTVQLATKNAKDPIPRHNPKAEDALVMRRPRKAPNGKQIVDVVVDPLLTKVLRKHQREGVSFLYECVMGMKDYDGEGAILADEMGLGKTLQTIALLWTLLKQNPIYEQAPVIKKALIVCPVTLIHNWKKEFTKWLGRDRVGVFVVEDKKKRLTDFTKGKSYSVMTIGYETLRLVQSELEGAPIDIVIADEGHRLKTATNKSAEAIKSLNTERRVILSGTPLQNDLSEFFTMVDFVNPGLVNKYTTFKRQFETPILKSQQPGASAKDLETGEARSEELSNITSQFILRRTSAILAEYLPSKTEHVVFCKPTAIQVSTFHHIIGTKTFNAALTSPAVSLELIMILKKVCNSPSLLLKKGDKGEDTTRADILDVIPQNLLSSANASGKIQVLDSLLDHIRTTTDEKVVLVSNYTSTMDVLASLLASRSYKYIRLDGKTAANKRQGLVDQFNRTPPSKSFVFLLSAKAGGTGINLIGASRLVLFDIDWNPATDLQAMARVHRDGQKRPCYIYRLLTQGAMDEKIFQRQVSKMGLADSIVDGKSAVSGFTAEELRDLFTLDESDDCQTHKLLSCGCGGRGTPLTESDDLAEIPRNDLAALSSDDPKNVVLGEDGTEIIDLAGESRSSWKTSKDYDWRAEEDAITRKARECKDSAGRAKMLSLMEYTHFDTSSIPPLPHNSPGDANSSNNHENVPVGDPPEGTIEDAALRSVLRDHDTKIGYIFSKLSTR